MSMALTCSQVQLHPDIGEQEKLTIIQRAHARPCSQVNTGNLVIPKNSVSRYAVF